jgi:biotin carboxyl carrier protein
MSVADFDLLLEGASRKISVETRDGNFVVREGRHVLETAVRRISENELQLRSGGRSVRVHLVRYGERTFVSVDGREFVVSESRPETGRRGEGDETTAETSLRVRSPMPGRVSKIAVVEGERVRKNQTLVIVEAMKMENEISTAIDGVVTKIHVAVGDLVDSERPLIEVEKR